MSSPSVGSKCHACAADAADVEHLRLTENLDGTLDSYWEVWCCVSGGGDEQGVMASSSSLNEALAVMERRPSMLDRREVASVVCTGMIVDKHCEVDAKENY